MHSSVSLHYIILVTLVPTFPVSKIIGRAVLCSRVSLQGTIALFKL